MAANLGPSFSPERALQIVDAAVASVLDLYEGADMYRTLHDGFGLTIQEMRGNGYVTGDELARICHVPARMLDCDMRLRDVLLLDRYRVSGQAVLACRDPAVRVPLKALWKLSPDDLDRYASLLDAVVADIRLDDEAPLLVLEDTTADALGRFHADHAAPGTD